MKGLEIEKVFFTKDSKQFAGFEFKHLESGRSVQHIAVGIDPSRLHGETNDSRLFTEKAMRTTRLIGFRTGKPCKDAKFLTSIQPLYYSTDPSICKEFLKPIDDGWMEEIPNYGPECNDPVLLQSRSSPVRSGSQGEARREAEPTASQLNQGESAGSAEAETLEAEGGGPETVTMVVIWLSFVVAAGLFVSEVLSFCNAKKNQQYEK